MNFYKYFAVLAILVLCLLGHQATEARFLGKVEHKLERDAKTAAKTVAKTVVKVEKHPETIKKVVDVGKVVVGVAGIAGSFAEA